VKVSQKVLVGATFVIHGVLLAGGGRGVALRRLEDKVKFQFGRRAQRRVTELNQILGGHRTTIDAQRVWLRFQICCSFWN